MVVVVAAVVAVAVVVVMVAVAVAVQAMVLLLFVWQRQRAWWLRAVSRRAVEKQKRLSLRGRTAGSTTGPPRSGYVALFFCLSVCRCVGGAALASACGRMDLVVVRTCLSYVLGMSRTRC